MNKSLKILLLTLLFSGCSDIERNGNSAADYEKLRAENDSLRDIITEINTKYVFDSISYRNIFSADNTFKPNSTVLSEIVVVAYSPKENYLVKFDTLISHEKVNPDTLEQRWGGYWFSTVLDKAKKDINVEIKLMNKYGQKDSIVLKDVIEAKN